MEKNNSKIKLFCDVCGQPALEGKWVGEGCTRFIEQNKNIGYRCYGEIISYKENFPAKKK